MKRRFINYACVLFAVIAAVGCSMNGDNDSNTDTPPVVTPSDTTAPTVYGTYPADLDTDVAINRSVTATFSEDMRSDTLNGETFTLMDGETAVAGSVEYSGRTATFVTSADLNINTLYTAAITTQVRDLVGNRLAAVKTWSFTTGAVIAAGPDPVILGTAKNFVILAKSSISTVPASAITGNVGVSPAAASYITGFSLVMDATNAFATSSQITGKVYAANYAAPCPQNMTTAVSDMENAYIDAAGRTNPDYTELNEGDISGLTLVPGLYKWGTGLTISSDITLSGNANDVWIFQVAGDMTMGPDVKMILEGGAQAKNIFWQSFGAITVGTTAHMEGVFLSSTGITLGTGATANGRLLSQTAVILDKSTVTEPAI